MMASINCKGKLIDLRVPKVMGILNLTPDSFYDGGKLRSEKAILRQAETMLAQGATFLDIGAYSSRPDATFVSEEEELHRLLPTVKLLVDSFPEAILSVDTFRSRVAHEAIVAGAALVNDISAGMLDKKMLQTVASPQVPYIMMHMRGTPQSMKTLTNYEDVVSDVIHYFSERLALARTAGINDCIIDPGFGFAKTIPQNFSLLQKLELFKNLEVPFLVGISRKSMIYKTLGTTPEAALNGTTALHSICLLKGASILRVHDVREALETVQLLAQLS